MQTINISKPHHSLKFICDPCNNRMHMLLVKIILELVMHHIVYIKVPCMTLVALPFTPMTYICPATFITIPTYIVQIITVKSTCGSHVLYII